ncbi:hypothetical protein [Actinomadura monticuli]|uniref:Uncharacterized protein n=1 Tax=Actinomadura monticuli TaxID=3097367 RepID=A0ABV4QCG7_9ACTN
MRPAPAAAFLALCAGCSGSSSGQVLCAPCAPPVTVSVSGLRALAGDRWRIRVCVGDLPCTTLPVSARATPSCGRVPCTWSGPDALQVTLGGEARPLAGVPVRVTASRKGKAGGVQGAATMTFTAGRKPCGCDRAHADVRVG